MSIPKEFLGEVEKMPPPLRKLLEAELAADNKIVEVGQVAAERRRAFRELCKIIGVNPEDYLRAKKH